MTGQRANQLRLVVADGDPGFAEAVAASFGEIERTVRAEPVTSDEEVLGRARRDDEDLDGVVVGDELDAPVTVVRRLNETTDLPTVFVGSAVANGTVGDAVDAGAVDCFPRTTAVSQYELVAETVATHWSGVDSDRTGAAVTDHDIASAYQEVFENVSDGLVVHDPETGEILDVNERFCEMNGYERGELVGETIDVVTAPGDRYSYEAARERIERAANEGAQLFEWRNQRKDGETFPVEVHLAVVRIDGRQRVLASIRDITERKRREREFEQIFDSVNDAIAVFDPETGDILNVNETYHDLLGYEDLETIQELGIEGLSVAEEGYTGEKGRRLIREVAASGDPQTVEWRGERVDGEQVWLEATLAPAEIGGQERVISIQRDVTERKRRERIIRALHETTDRFQDAETREEVCEAAVEAAETVLDLSMPACWLPDDDGDALKPVAASERAWEIPGGPGVFEPGTFEYEVYEGDELTVYDPRERWDETPFTRTFLVPMGDHGLLGAGEPDIESYEDVTLDAARILARHARSALDRVERGRELRESEERFRTIAERVNEIIYLANADLTEVQYVNPAYADIYGRPVEELYEDPRAFLRAVHPADRESYEAEVEAMLADIAAGDPDERYEFEYRIERPDGEVRWIEATGYPIVDADGPHRYVAIAEDVTERHEREQTLETFHEVTRDLTEVDSHETACRRAVDAADDVLGFPLVSVHLYDEDTGQLEPVATTEQLQALDADVPAFAAGDSLPWQVYVEGESTTETSSMSDVYGPGVSGPDIVLPLGPHGVMLVGAPAESFDSGEVELAQILAATLEASLNHVSDERALADREEQLRHQQERAERLERLNAIIRDIEQVTIEQSARAGIETAVCERLTAVDPHDLVWIAESGVGDDELLPRTSDGDKDVYVDAVSLALDSGAGGHPAIAAYTDSESKVVSNVATEVTTGDWRTTALQHGIQSVVAVPIRYENTIHGVLAVESEEPDAFDDATREVLTELGRSIGYAITVTEREKALESESTTELEFSVDTKSLFMIRAADERDCQVRVERTIRRAGGAFSTFYAVDGADPEAVVELADRTASIERAQVVTTGEDDQSGLVEVRAPTWFGSVFSDHGAVVRKAAADGDDGSLVVEAPRGANIRALVEAFQERYPGSGLVAQRQRERTVRSLFELQDTLRDGLTDRQWEALETAYSAGYFAWPREISGEEVADLLGITQPTFNKHLRTAERTAFRMLLDRKYPDTDEE